MAESAASRGRPFISVLFECCRVYNRVYRNPAGTAYVGWCPRCGKRVEVKVGPGGGENRVFRAQ